MLKRRYSVSKLLSLTVLLLTVGLLISCASQTIENTDDVTENDTVTFTDALGREVSVKKYPKRVAALIGSFADVWMLSGGTLCASADDAWDDFCLDMGDAVNLGPTKSPSTEKLLASDPDLVIASSATAANVELLETLESAGITTAFFNVSTFDDYLDMLKICTDITGRSDLYKKNGTDIKERIDEITSKFSNASADEHRKVLFLRASAGFIRAKNSTGSVLGEMLKELGCINIADRDSSLLENLSIEAILQNEPYHIFIVQVGDDSAAVRENVESMMRENPAWQALTAVTEGRVHYMDKRLFNLKPNALWGDSYEILCEILK